MYLIGILNENVESSHVSKTAIQGKVSHLRIATLGA